MRRLVAIFLVVVVVALLAQSQETNHDARLDKRGALPNPGRDRIEVRFALGEKAVECKRFHLWAKINGQVIINGKFSSSFQIPSEAKNLPHKDALELEFACGKERWRFSDVNEGAFQTGWWWVGTDYPPFQADFQGPRFKDAIWIRYLMTDPMEGLGFDVFTLCPKELKDQVPGPCHDK